MRTYSFRNTSFSDSGTTHDERNVDVGVITTLFARVHTVLADVVAVVGSVEDVGIRKELLGFKGLDKPDIAMGSSSAVTSDVKSMKTAEWATPVGKPPGKITNDSKMLVWPLHKIRSRVNATIELTLATNVGSLYFPVLILISNGQ